MQVTERWLRQMRGVESHALGIWRRACLDGPRVLESGHGARDGRLPL